MPVARPMSRAGLRYSPLSEVTASQPAKAHTSSAAAEPTASQPCGANGVRLPSSAWGSETQRGGQQQPAEDERDDQLHPAADPQPEPVHRRDQAR